MYHNLLKSQTQKNIFPAETLIRLSSFRVPVYFPPQLTGLFVIISLRFAGSQI